MRGLALLGVLAINLLTAFRVSLFQQFIAPVGGSHIDQVIGEVLAIAIEMKAFAVFSFLFGVGLAIQYERILRHEFPLRLLVRRLLVLLGFGLIHLFLIWNGDILAEYAIAGLVALPFLFLPRQAIIFGLLLCLAGRIVASLTVWFPSQAWYVDHVREATRVYATAGYIDYVRYSVTEFWPLLQLHLLVFPRTVALFLIGAWTWRHGVFRDPRKQRLLLFAVAVGGTLLGIFLQQASPARYVFSGENLRAAASVSDALAQMAMGLGYIAIALCITEFTHWRAFLSWAAPLGRMAFTNYIVESVIFGWIFFGYGLGQFGRMTLAQAAAIGLAVYCVQVLYSHWWLRRFRYGPLEWLWRALMYGQWQLMLRRPSAIGVGPD